MKPMAHLLGCIGSTLILAGTVHAADGLKRPLGSLAPQQDTSPETPFDLRAPAATAPAAKASGAAATYHMPAARRSR